MSTITSTSLLRLSLRPTHHHLNHHYKPPSRTSTPLSPLPTPSLHLFSTPTTRPKTPPKRNTIIAMSSPSSTTPTTDRIISALVYVLPFINGLHYGRYLFSQYPTLSLLVEPLLPFLSLYKSVPYASFVSFFALFLGVVKNQNFSYYVRFNAMQALVLDVLLVLPLLLQRVLSPGSTGSKLVVLGSNVIFAFLSFCFVYGFVWSLLGKTPYLPFLDDAARRQL